MDGCVASWVYLWIPRSGEDKCFWLYLERVSCLPIGQLIVGSPLGVLGGWGYEHMIPTAQNILALTLFEVMSPPHLLWAFPGSEEDLVTVPVLGNNLLPTHLQG